MTNCKNCGAQMDPQATTCPSCGAVQTTQQPEAQQAAPSVPPAQQAQPTNTYSPQNGGYSQQNNAYPPQGNGYPPQGNPYPYQPYPMQQVNDSGSFGWAVLGFFLPLVGLILFLIWKDSKPQCAKKAGIGALVGFIANILLSVAITLFSAAIFSSVYYY